MSDALQQKPLDSSNHSRFRKAADVTGRAGIVRGYVHFCKCRRGRGILSFLRSSRSGAAFMENGVGCAVEYEGRQG